MATINFTGTGGIIEGNLGTANVNVNLDAALDFDGSNDYVDLNYGNGVNAQAGFSVSAWIKKDSLGVNQMWIGSDTGSNQRFYIGIRSNYFAFGYADEGWVNAGQQITAGDWYHVCVTATSGAQKLYVNGVEITASAKTVTDSFTLASDLYLGRLGTGDSYNWDGKITDVKIFGDVLTAAEVQELSSKINYDISVGSIDNLTRWFKSNAGSGTTIADDSGNSGTAADIGGATWIYDQYSVDVYDNSTTTDGTFTVTKGKVEGLALTSLDFSGDTQLVSCTSNTFYNSKTAFSVSAWIRPDANNISFQTVVNARDSGNDGMALSVLNQTVRLRIGDGGSDDLVTSNVITSADRWYHLVATRDASNNTAIYIDGVLSTTGSSSKTISVSSGNFGIGGRPSDTDADEFNGDIRDVGCWSYALSAEQVNSLYSGTYPPTPNHEYKLDEGSGTTVNDTGTETAANGTITGATYTNGTLDLDGDFTIATNGVMSAPRGILACGDKFESNASDPTIAFIHNDGTVKMDSSGNAQLRGGSSSTGTIFFNLLHDSGGYVDAYEYYKVINKLTVDSSRTWYINGSSHVKLGDTTRDINGELEINGVLHLSSSNTGTGTSNSISGDNTNAGGAALIDINNGASSFANGAAKATEFKNLNFDGAFTTPGNSLIVKCMGDMEFDAVTVSNGDQLNLNGQRALIDGVFDVDGTVDADGMFILNNAIDYDGSAFSNAHKCTMIFRNTTGGNIANDMVGVTNMKNLAFLQESGSTHTIKGTNQYTMNGNVIVGGRIDLENQSQTNIIDLKIPAGGELVPGSGTLTCSGDFTSSGGLIGGSALDLTGSEEVTGTDNLDEVATSNRVTVEAWFKATTDANYRAIFSRGTAWGTGNIYLYMNSDGNIQFSMHDLGATVTSTTSGLADGKWHHAAATYDQTNLKLYIDGKLEATFASTASLNTQTGGFKIGDRSGANWEGQIGRVSIWDAALTPAQIREMLFYDFATADSEATIPDANCIGWWQFDEGRSTAVADSSTNNADGTLNSAAWVGGGTFTKGTSTLIFSKSGTQTLNFKASDNFENITINAGSTVSLKGFGLGSGNPLDCFGNLVVTGALTDSGNSSIMKLRTADKTHDFSGTLTSLYQIIVDISSGSLNIPALNTPRLRFSTSVTGTATGNLTLTEELQVDTNTTFVANGKTITAKLVDLNDGTFNLGQGTLILSHTGGSNGFDTNAASVLAAGPGATISGSSAGTTFKSRNNFVVVGKVENLDVTNEELSVTGQVINCTGEIHQQFPTIDHDQQLDFDTADDRDIILGRDLDKNTELINS